MICYHNYFKIIMIINPESTLRCVHILHVDMMFMLDINFREIVDIIE